jgi:hypothetical protein
MDFVSKENFIGRIIETPVPFFVGEGVLEVIYRTCGRSATCAEYVYSELIHDRYNIRLVTVPVPANISSGAITGTKDDRGY